MFDMADARLYAPATQRNREAIAEVLATCLPSRCRVLEVAAGTGEHAVYFAQRFAGWRWQPSDMAPNLLDSIRAWAAHSPCNNLQVPVRLDVCEHPWPVEDVDAVLAINLLHISPAETIAHLMRGARAALRAGGKLVVYGPFFIDGVATAPSNTAFDASLRQQDPRWGIRQWEVVNAAAQGAGLIHCETVTMPANNVCSVWQAYSETAPAEAEIREYPVTPRPHPSQMLQARSVQYPVLRPSLMSPMQRKEKVLDFWQIYEPNLETMYLREDASEIDEIERPEILALLPELQGARVLELAAGIGRFTGRFAELGARQVTAVDIVEKFVAANREANGTFSNIDFVCADAMTLEHAPQSFDFIFINWMMMYLEDHEVSELAKRMQKWLKPGGHLFFRESCAPNRVNLDMGYYVHYRTPDEYTAAFADLALQKHGHIEAHARLDNPHQLYWLYQR